MTKISLVKTADRTQGTRKAIDLLEINPVKGKSVVLKPNFNTADPAPGSTHYDTLHALILSLKEMGARQNHHRRAQRPRRQHPQYHGEKGHLQDG